MVGCNSCSMAGLWWQKTPFLSLYLLDLPAGVTVVSHAGFLLISSPLFHISHYLFSVAFGSWSSPVCFTCSACWSCLFFEISFYSCNLIKILSVVKVTFPQLLALLLIYWKSGLTGWQELFTLFSMSILGNILVSRRRDHFQLISLLYRGLIPKPQNEIISVLCSN